MQPALGFAVILVLTAPAHARSDIATDLVNLEIAEGCGKAGGRIEPAAVIERDLTGDGLADLVISHEGISCAGGGESSFCGQLCSIKFFVRRGERLELDHELLGRGMTVGDGAIPPINMYAAGGRPGAVKWNGTTFAPANQSARALNRRNSGP